MMVISNNLCKIKTRFIILFIIKCLVIINAESNINDVIRTGAVLSTTGATSSSMTDAYRYN